MINIVTEKNKAYIQVEVAASRSNRMGKELGNVTDRASCPKLSIRYLGNSVHTKFLPWRLTLLWFSSSMRWVFGEDRKGKNRSERILKDKV